MAMACVWQFQLKNAGQQFFVLPNAEYSTATNQKIKSKSKIETYFSTTMGNKK